MKSPFLNEFGSSSGCIVPKQSIGCVRICPFHENGKFFCDLKKREPFRKWLEEGRPKKSRLESQLILFLLLFFLSLVI